MPLPTTIGTAWVKLSHRLHRNHSTVTKDVGLLEKMGLLVS